jgi:hypothetical protein
VNLCTIKKRKQNDQKFYSSKNQHLSEHSLLHRISRKLLKDETKNKPIFSRYCAPAQDICDGKHALGDGTPPFRQHQRPPQRKKCVTSQNSFQASPSLRISASVPQPHFLFHIKSLPHSV